MKTWHVVALFGVLGLVLVVVVLSKPKVVASNPMVAPGAPDGGIVKLAGVIGTLFGSKVVAPSAAPNEGTYRTDINATVSGNTLVDPNTGKQLTYGTD